MFPFTVVPAYNLPVYASQRPLPDATQDSVRGCSLGFTAAVIADGRLQRACKAQRSFHRTCGAGGKHIQPLLRFRQRASEKLAFGPVQLQREGGFVPALPRVLRQQAAPAVK